MNDLDQARSERFGRRFVMMILSLPPEARLRVEVETDRHGHVRPTLRFDQGHVLTEEPEEAHPTD